MQGSGSGEADGRISIVEEGAQADLCWRLYTWKLRKLVVLTLCVPTHPLKGFLGTHRSVCFSLKSSLALEGQGQGPSIPEQNGWMRRKVSSCFPRRRGKLQAGALLMWCGQALQTLATQRFRFSPTSLNRHLPQARGSWPWQHLWITAQGAFFTNPTAWGQLNQSSGPVAPAQLRSSQSDPGCSPCWESLSWMR